MKFTSPIIYFNDQCIAKAQLETEFIEHTFHFKNGISKELRSYEYNGNPHLFRAEKYFQELLLEAEEMNINIPFGVDELQEKAYTLLYKNQLVNARISVLVYTKDGDSHCMVHASEANPFSIQEKIHLDSTTKLNQSVRVGKDGLIHFSSTNPFFYVKHGVLYTPKVEDTSSGIIRDTIIECAILLGYPVIEKTISKEEIEGSEVVFFSTATHEINFVSRFEEYSFTDNWRDTMAMDLLMLFRQQATNKDFQNYSII